MSRNASRLAILLGSASVLTLTTGFAANAAQGAAPAAAPAPVEEVLITGSLISGTEAVGVPVTVFGTQDLIESGYLEIGAFLRGELPSAYVSPARSAANIGSQQQRITRVNVRGLDADALRSLMLIDGARFPAQGNDLNGLDPSVIPVLAVDRIDVLTDGASATYGSDAISAVFNVVLKRNFDGAVTMLHYYQPDEGGQRFLGAQLFGTTWDSIGSLGAGGITLTYEYSAEREVLGTAHPENYTVDYRPWGLDDKRQIIFSLPGTITTGAPTGMAPGNVGEVCSNCWMVPAGSGRDFNSSLNGGLGPLTPGSAATITWGAFSANSGNRGVNLIDNPLAVGWEQSAQTKSAFVVTFDQEIFPGVSVFGSGFDTNRRVSFLQPPYYSNAISSSRTITVPTTNPYYPTGAPANLRVSYSMFHEIPLNLKADEISYRWQLGFNFDDLPFGWTGRAYYAYSHESGGYTRQTPNQNAMAVAAGNTVGGISKPANVPYLNLFCDPYVFQCNSPATLAYISGTRIQETISKFKERTIVFDGPVFELPAGPIRAAIGGTYESHSQTGLNVNNGGSAPAGQGLIYLWASESTNIWAAYGQVNIPVFGDEFNLPLFRKLDVEFSARHDSYSGDRTGTTNNPRVAVTWLVDDMVGLTLRGSYGTSFRFGSPNEANHDFAGGFQTFNIAGGDSLPISCTGGVPRAGSVSADLVAAGAACNALLPGVHFGGAPNPAVRSYEDSSGNVVTRLGGVDLAPETAKNYSLGFQLTPDFSIFRGLDLEFTWYRIHIDRPLTPSAGVNSSTYSDPNLRYRYVLPSDLGCPVSANAAPTTCAAFQNMIIQGLLTEPASLNPSEAPNVRWISDGGTLGTGFLEVEGLDWTWRYDFDMGNYGAWNVGMVGTYFLHRLAQADEGFPVIDFYHANLAPIGGIAQDGVTQLPRWNWRARLGWTSGPYTVTGFLNATDHYFDSRLPPPPNVNFQCTTAGGTVGGGNQLCAISDYSNFMSSWHTVDLSFAYNTGEMPTNTYLQNINITLNVQNVMGKKPPFMYRPTTSNGNPTAYDVLKPNTGRQFGITLVKTW